LLIVLSLNLKLRLYEKFDKEPKKNLLGKPRKASKPNWGLFLTSTTVVDSYGKTFVSDSDKSEHWLDENAATSTNVSNIFQSYPLYVNICP
jgi:hypothetical protein